MSEYIQSLIREAQNRKAREAVESKLLEALAEAPEEMGKMDWEALRSRVRLLASEKRTP